MSGKRAISTTSRRELSSSFFFSCKARRRRKFTAFLRCVTAVVLGQWYKAVVCVCMYIYIYTHTHTHIVMNTTILQLVAIWWPIYRAETCSCILYYILLLIVIFLCSWLYVYIDIYTLRLCIIHAILTETLACFVPGRARDLSAPLYC